MTLQINGNGPELPRTQEAAQRAAELEALHGAQEAAPGEHAGKIKQLQGLLGLEQTGIWNPDEIKAALARRPELEAQMQAQGINVPERASGLSIQELIQMLLNGRDENRNGGGGAADFQGGGGGGGGGGMRVGSTRGALQSHLNRSARSAGGGYRSMDSDVAYHKATHGMSTGEGKAGSFIDAAMSQQGDAYVFGAEANLNDSNPDAFDCSELVQWAGAQAGVNIPDGSAAQERWVRQHGKQMSVSEALRTPGALLFREGHVAISLGDGRTIEAKGSKYGVGVFNANNRFTSAGLVPGLSYA